MERKIGGGSRTLAIDGVPIRGVEKDRRVEAELASGPKLRPVKDATPTLGQQRLAGFAAELALRFHRGSVGWKDMEVRFFEPDGEVEGLAPTRASMGRYIKLAANLTGERLAETALHEARHVIQNHLPPGLTMQQRETDADTFAAKWLPSVMAAWKASEGELSRVTLKDRRPPFAGARSGDVVIDRTTGRVYQYRPRNISNAWTEIRR